MSFKQVIKIVVFMMILGVIVYFLCDIFEHQNNYMAKGYASYKSFDEGTVDAVFIGTSGVNRCWITIKGFDMYGMTVMDLSTDALPCWITIDMIKEAYRFQNPKLVILDMRMFTKGDPDANPKLAITRSRRLIDTLDFFSPNRIDAIDRSLKVVSKFDPDTSRFDPSFFFSFIQYHGMWADEGFDPISEIGCKPAKYLGFYVTRGNSIKAKAQKAPKWTDEVGTLSQVAIDSLDEIIAYSRENGIELLFVDTPHIVSKSDSMRNNALCRYLDENGQKYMLYSNEEWFLKDEEREDEELVRRRFDRKIHFYDDSHLNFDGAVIFTRVFADYLHENYDLPDHSEDPRCESWVGRYETLKKRIKKFKEDAAKKKG